MYDDKIKELMEILSDLYCYTPETVEDDATVKYDRGRSLLEELQSELDWLR